MGDQGAVTLAIEALEDFNGLVHGLNHILQRLQYQHDDMDIKCSSLIADIASLEHMIKYIAALQSKPGDVDIETLKKPYTDLLSEMSLEQAKGWNDCLDFLTQNGYRITKAE